MGNARRLTPRNQIKQRTNGAYQREGGQRAGVLPVVHLSQEEPSSGTPSLVCKDFIFVFCLVCISALL